MELSRNLVDIISMKGRLSRPNFIKRYNLEADDHKKSQRSPIFMNGTYNRPSSLEENHVSISIYVYMFTARTQREVSAKPKAQDDSTHWHHWFHSLIDSILIYSKKEPITYTAK